MNYRKMLSGDLTAEIAYWREVLRELTAENAPGWLVALCDEYINLADAELHRRQRAKTAPTVIRSRINPEYVTWTAEDVDLPALISAETGHTYRNGSGNNYRGPCPWCAGSDRATKFRITHRPAARDLYYCFACGKGGDAIQFLRDYRGLSFPEAVQELAQRLGREIAPRERGAARQAKKKWRAGTW